MANLNKVMLIGNLTRDPELRYTPSGATVCEFALAMNRQWTSKQGEKREDVCFIDIVCWARTAEICAEYLKKGRQAFVEGRLTLDRWETPEGQKRSRIRVTAERVQFLGGRGEGGGRREPEPEMGQPAPAEAPEAPEGAPGNENIPF